MVIYCMYVCTYVGIEASHFPARAVLLTCAVWASTMVSVSHVFVCAVCCVCVYSMYMHMYRLTYVQYVHAYVPSYVCTVCTCICTVLCTVCTCICTVLCMYSMYMHMYRLTYVQYYVTIFAVLTYVRTYYCVLLL